MSTFQCAAGISTATASCGRRQPPPGPFRTRLLPTSPTALASGNSGHSPGLVSEEAGGVSSRVTGSCHSARRHGTRCSANQPLLARAGRRPRSAPASANVPLHPAALLPGLLCVVHPGWNCKVTSPFSILGELPVFHGSRTILRSRPQCTRIPTSPCKRLIDKTEGKALKSKTN